MKESNRRSFLRKIFTLTASAGVAGLLLDRIPAKSVLPPVQAADGGNIVIGSANSGTASTSLTASGAPAAFQATNTGSSAGLQGDCTAGTGVLGTATTGTGVQGTASSLGGTALSGFVSDPGAIPIVAQGAASQSANLQQWKNGTGTVASVNASGAMLATQVGQSSPNIMYVPPGNPPSFTNAMNPTGSATEADGLAIYFTPKLTGNVLVIVAVDLYVNTPYDAFAMIWYGIGTAPTFGASLPSGGVRVSPYRGSANATAVFTVYISGLTIGTQYWFDLGHAVNAGGTGTHNNISYTLIET